MVPNNLITYLSSQNQTLSVEGPPPQKYLLYSKIIISLSNGWIMISGGFSLHCKQTWTFSTAWVLKPRLSFSLSSFSVTFTALVPLMSTYSEGRCHQPKPSMITGLGLPHSLTLYTHLSCQSSAPRRLNCSNRKLN